MWVRSQDRKNLANVSNFKVSRTFGNKANKFSILGEYNSGNIFGNISIPFGYYNSLDAALKELDSIEKHITENSNKVYQMN